MRRPAAVVTATTVTPRLELFWIPLGAGALVVRGSGRLYEVVAARWRRRQRQSLFHSALIATSDLGRDIIEMTPVIDEFGPEQRGVVAEGAVGARWLGRFRIFRYEIHCWRGGDIPDIGAAVASPILISTDPVAVSRAVRLASSVPTPVWGRDELGGGEMWNSNSVVAWILTRAGVIEAAGEPPERGRAPGWDAGVRIARRPNVSVPNPSPSPTLIGANL